MSLSNPNLLYNTLVSYTVSGVPWLSSVATSKIVEPVNVVLRYFVASLMLVPSLSKISNNGFCCNSVFA